MKNKILLTICGLLVLSGCAKSPKLSDGKEIVASIDGKEVTAEELYASMKEDYGTNSLLSLIDDIIIDKEILKDSDEDKDAREEANIEFEQYKANYNAQWSDFLQYYGYQTDEELLNDIIKNKKTTNIAKKYIKAKIEEKDLKQYYDDNYSTELSVKHILIKSTATNDMTNEEKKTKEDEAYNKAVELINKLNNGEEFDKLAKENSDDTGSKENGGLINGVNKAGYDANFYKAALELTDGTYTKTPVKSQYGYHIIYTINRKEADSYDSLKESLYDKVVDEKMSNDTNLISKIWSNEIRTKYNLSIVDTTIKTSYEVYKANIEAK